MLVTDLTIKMLMKVNLPQSNVRLAKIKFQNNDFFLFQKDVVSMCSSVNVLRDKD